MFLRQTSPVVEQINGKGYEVWLKVPGKTNEFILKTKTVTASGIIVGYSNLAYLVTAKHFAAIATEDCEVIMRGDHLEPWKFKLSSITGQPAIRWFHHAIADVSVYPLPTITSEGAKALDRRAVPIELLESSRTNLPSRDDDLTVLGFPLGLGAEGEFIPLSRR